MLIKKIKNVYFSTKIKVQSKSLLSSVFVYVFCSYDLHGVKYSCSLSECSTDNLNIDPFFFLNTNFMFFFLLPFFVIVVVIKTMECYMCLLKEIPLQLWMKMDIVAVILDRSDVSCCCMCGMVHQFVFVFVLVCFLLA